MEPLTLDELERESARFDEIVGTATYLDRFCSSTAWILPAHEALMPPRRPWLFRWADGYVAMAGGLHERGFRYVEPLEASWGLACPVVARDADDAVERLLELARVRASDWDVFVVCGVLDDAPVQAKLVDELAASFDLHEGSSTARHVASLEGGIDGFLRRRSRSFRRTLRRARAAADAAGVRFESAPVDADADSLYDRIQRVEAATWKGRAGVGIDAGAMRELYLQMCRRLAARGGLRVSFARLEDRDIAYILGGVFRDTYRGLQFGYDANCARYGLGNLCQLHQIESLCAEGIASYDLGTTGGAYKRRWAERAVSSTTLLAVQRASWPRTA